MSKLSKKKNLFFFHHRNAGIPHLLLAIAVIRLVVLFVSLADPSGALINAMNFSTEQILHGQVWRILTFLFVPNSNPLYVMIEVLFYYFMDRTLEAKMGRLKLNLFVLSSILLLTAVSIGVHLILKQTQPEYALSMALGSLYDIGTGNISFALDYCLFFALAAAVPDAQLLLFFVIPIKVKYLAWIDLGLIVYSSIQLPIPGFLIFLVPIVMLVLFFRADIPDLLPDWLRYGVLRMKRKVQRTASASHQRSKAHIHEVKRDYRHKCTVCGRTDVSDPDLEFRYCSQCSGYFCYCADHINNHTHIIDVDVKE